MLSAPSQSHKTHCQYCNAVCLVKNFKRHIKEVHPDNDPKDLKDNRSQFITSSFRSKRSSDLEDENLSRVQNNLVVQQKYLKQQK